MRVVLSLADVILDTTEMYRAGIAARVVDKLAYSEQQALINALFEPIEVALSRGDFFNEKLISSLNSFDQENVEYFIVCTPTEETLGYRIADLLRDRYQLHIADVYSQYFEDTEEYLAELGVDMIITNDKYLLTSACGVVPELVCYGIHEVSLPLSFTTDSAVVGKRIAEYLENS